jgi:hypothetical protein
MTYWSYFPSSNTYPNSNLFDQYLNLIHSFGIVLALSTYLYYFFTISHVKFSGSSLRLNLAQIWLDFELIIACDNFSLIPLSPFK